MSKKRLLWVLFSLCLILSMVVSPIYGCTSKTDEPIRLTVAVTTLQRTTNPFLATGRESILIVSRIYEPLVTVREDGTVVPRIAKSWDWTQPVKQ